MQISRWLNWLCFVAAFFISRRTSAFVFLAGALAATAVSAQSRIFVREVASGFPEGLAVRNAGSGDPRVFVVSQNGFVRIRDAGAPGPRDVPFLDVSPSGTAPPGNFASGGERGLLGLAFHPKYAANGFFFVFYTDGLGDVRITRFSRSSQDPNLADPSSGVTILRVNKDQSNHNGGDLHFGPDGFLYFAIGDGGGGGDPCERAQMLNPANLLSTGVCAADPNYVNSGGNPDARALQGKMVRIDIDNTTPAGANQLCADNADGSAAYAIPASNPFSGNDAQSGCDEIYHYGLRNPYRFSFDRLKGDLFIGDVGQFAQEEISFGASGAAGLNFGWDICEGTANFEGSCATAGLTAPILFYTRGAANPGVCSVIGGFRYRGTEVTQIAARYLYADFCSSQVWVATEGAGGAWTSAALPPLTGVSIAGFGEDSRGELYLADLGDTGRLYQIFGLFSDGFE